MITETLIKKYNKELALVIKTNTHCEVLSLIRKFDYRFKMQIDQHYSQQSKYFNPKFTKNERRITHLYQKISSAWFCFEILMLLCKKYDSKKEIILIKEQKKYGEEFRKRFLDNSNLKSNCNEIIKDYYEQSISLFTKIATNKLKIIFISQVKDSLNSLITSNKHIRKIDYNSSIQSFYDEISEMERIHKANFNKKKNREEYNLKHLNLSSFIGFCYVLRNHYVHNGLMYRSSANNDKLYGKSLQEFTDTFNHLMLTLALAILKRINIEN